MNDFNKKTPLILTLGGSMSELVQKLLTQNKKLDEYLCVIPTRCGHRETIEAFDKFQNNCSVVAIGFAGGVNASINVGDIIIPIKARFADSNYESMPNEVMIQNINKFPWSFSSRIHHGTVWTYQSIIHADSEKKTF